MPENTHDITQTIDTSGLSCPMPLLKTKKALNGLNPGDILKIISTDPGSDNDIPTFGNKGGNTYLGKSESGNTICHFIKKG